jgi:SAM-dependent methyltransferase
MTMITTTPDAFAERLMGSMVGALDTLAVYMGDKLGLYEALVDSGPMSQAELVAATGIHERYAREWLEHQVTASVLTVDDAALAPGERRYELPEAHGTVLADEDSLAFMAPFVRVIGAAGAQLPRHVGAFQTGGGVPWAQFGADMRTGQADVNRPWYLSQLGSVWLPSVPEAHAALTAGGRAADIGCGEGWSSIAMALAYPQARVHGYDIDGPSIEAARLHAADAGVADRVQFHHADAVATDGAGSFDVVSAFECIHDMPDPVSVLRRMRELAADDGVVMVMDEAVGERFGDRDDEIERLMYGMSLFVCLPDGMSHEGSVGTGTLMRSSTIRSYAIDAGFSDVEVLPIENDMWRFYRLLA